jgi:hypothetical protein
MALIVELDVFSTLPNPNWVMTAAQERDFRNRTARKRVLSASHLLEGVLGYRGFIVSDTDPDAAADKPFKLVRSPGGRRAGGRVRVARAAGPAAGSTNKIAGVPDLEEFLLKTARTELDAPLKRYVRAEIPEVTNKVAAQASVTSVSCPRCVAADAPGYNPGPWNAAPVLTQNNCYNYANNQVTNTFAQPGRATGSPVTGLSCPGVEPSARSDGLANAANFNTPLSAGAGWYVALVIWPGRDYHWYRQDNGGCWSHKPGSTPAKDTDNSGARIADPQTCDRGPYSVFCRYMISKAGVRIR